MKYAEAKFQTIAHMPSEITSYTVAFPTNIEGFNIKSIKVVSEESIDFRVTILDADDNSVIYESLDESKYHYDTVDLVYRPTTKAFVVKIHNKGALTTRFNIEIKGIEVR